MTRFRVLVADDEPLARGMVAALLQNDPEVESVIECGDARTVREIIARQRPDIVFLDVEMPEATGLEIAADLAEDAPVIVFITAFSEYATQAFEVSASDYILKPFSDERFSEALQRAKRRVRQRRLAELAGQVATISSELRVDDKGLSNSAETGYLRRLAFKHNDRAVIVKTADIVWIEAEDYYVRIHARQSRYLVRSSLTFLEERLDPRDFLRVHRTAIVNIEAVREVHDKGALSVVLADGTEVPVSRSRRSHVESTLVPRLRPQGNPI